MKKAISPQKIAYLIFALIGALIMLAVYINYYAQPQGGLFCAVYSNIYQILPSEDEPPPLPRSCIQKSVDYPDSAQISSKQKSEVEDRLVEYIIGCYQKNKANSNLTTPCYQLEIPYLVGEISEIDITDNMVATGFICDALGNSQVIDKEGQKRNYSSIDGKFCGKEDGIIWLVHQNTIKKGDTVEIKYANLAVKIIA